MVLVAPSSDAAVAVSLSIFCFFAAGAAALAGAAVDASAISCKDTIKQI
jgi:hypothetical protein